MELFETLFNPTSIYDMFFFNVKSVLMYSTLKELAENNKPMYENWKYLSKTKYNFDMDLEIDNPDADDICERLFTSESTYQDNAINYPEFCKIAAITYATVYFEEGKMQRDLKKIIIDDESLMLESFMAELSILSSAATKSSPIFFPPLCGHNIISRDIPLLIKRFMILNENFTTIKSLPLILKRCLNIKPWESSVIDTAFVWKLGGYDYTSLMLTTEFLGLKKTIDLLPDNELSKYYWNNIKEHPKETLDFFSKQSATQTNLVIQLMNKFRQI